MPEYDTQDIRNLALVGHSGAGKTTLAEALLTATGTVPQGTRVCDFLPQEKAMGHSLDTALVHFETQGRRVHLLDTPGLRDFSGRALSVLPAVETAVLVIDAETGIQPVTQQMMDAAAARGLDRFILVNRIDAEGADLEGLTARIQETFGRECLPINLPADGGARVVDCFFDPEPADTDFASVESAHDRLVDQVVEVDEALMEVYLEQGEELAPEQLHDPFEQALREGHLIPICYASAATGAGIEPLLKVIARLMPHPGEGNPPPYMKGEGAAQTPVKVRPDPARHVLAHCFKVVNDPFRGKIGMFRMHQGSLRPDSSLFIGDARKPFKPNHLYRVQGNELEEAPGGVPGDILAVARVDEIHFDAVLHDSHDEDRYHLSSIECPLPMFGLAVEPKKRGDEQRLAEALAKLQEEDPCFHVEHNPSANETILRGLGELHLRVLLGRLQDDFHVEVDTRPPSIAYRETITQPAEGHYRHKKQTGGAGQFGEVFLRIEPLPPGQGFAFEDAVVGGAIPGQFIPAVEKGVRQAIDEGALAGFSIQDVKVTVYDGKHHPVDSKEIAFVTAGKRAFLAAVEQARPVILEPLVRIEITAANEHMGDLSGDLAGRRGRILGSESLADGRVRIEGEVPLAELEGYDSRLNAITGGEGAYNIAFSRYQAVPANIQAELIQRHSQREE